MDNDNEIIIAQEKYNALIEAQIRLAIITDIIRKNRKYITDYEMYASVLGIKDGDEG